MQPLKPYFLGQEQPPHAAADDAARSASARSTSTNVGNTARHLTFFEMLGNFSIGDYFKQGAVEFAWELSPQGFGFDPERHLDHRLRGRRRARPRARRGGDRARGRRSGCRASGSSAARARRTSGRPGPTGPCGPCSELYLDRGLDVRQRRRPARAARTSASSSTGTSSSCSTTRTRTGTLTPLPAQNIDTGPGPQPHGRDPAGRPVGLRDRPVPRR